MVLFAGIVTTWTVYGKDIEDNTEDITELKTEGCTPAREHTTEIAVLKEQFKGYHTKQEAMHKQILERLPE